MHFLNHWVGLDIFYIEIFLLILILTFHLILLTFQHFLTDLVYMHSIILDQHEPESNTNKIPRTTLSMMFDEDKISNKP